MVKEGRGKRTRASSSGRAQSSMEGSAATYISHASTNCKRNMQPGKA